MIYKNKIKELGFEKLDEYKNINISNKGNIKYTDGDIEKTILNILKKESKKTGNIFSQLEDQIIDWPTEYHFSWVRQNIIKPIDFKKEDVVLELGGGTGIISEYVVGKVEKLITIEGTEIRAKSISTRCSNNENIDIIVANFLELDLLSIFGENSFSKILLIGVLEYVPKYSKNKDSDPINKLLDDCKKLLKPDGELVIAIENKIGLKYLLGREEDHVSKKHYGTQSLYQKDDVITFTKKQLLRRLNNSGFLDVESYYPFPDYKLPKVIIKEDFNLNTPKSKELIVSMLSGIQSKNYSNRSVEILEEDRILSNFLEEEILGSISNSFLFVAKQIKSKKTSTPFLYYFSTSRRYQFSNEMIFKNSNEGIEVSKKWYGESTNGEILNHISNNENNYLLKEGKILSDILKNYYLLNDKENYLIVFYKWLNLLIDKIDDFENSFDLLPMNVIYDENGKLTFFDFNEWKTKEKFTIPQIIKRYVLMNKNHFEWLFGIQNNIDDFVLLILDKNNIKIKDIEELKKVDVVHDYIRANIFKNDYLKINNKKIVKKIVTRKNKKPIWKKWVKYIIPPIFVILRNRIKK